MTSYIFQLQCQTHLVLFFQSIQQLTITFRSGCCLSLLSCRSSTAASGSSTSFLLDLLLNSIGLLERREAIVQSDCIGCVHGQMNNLFTQTSLKDVSCR